MTLDWYTFPAEVELKNRLDYVRAREDIPDVWRDATYYQPSSGIEEALELAVNLERPLLLTGKPGSGKTMAAYWAALALGIEPPKRNDAAGYMKNGFFHVQVRSTSTAQSLKYEFDAIECYRDAQQQGTAWDASPATYRKYIRKGPLWLAFEHQGDVVLLLDEIDKAPRDMPNDLLLEFDRSWFDVHELRPKGKVGDAEPAKSVEHIVQRVKPSAGGGKRVRFLQVLTSNGERDMSEAFLRRCVHHHIELDPQQVRKVVAARLGHGGKTVQSIALTPELADFAVEQFMHMVEEAKNDGSIREPSLGELLVWLHALQKAPSALESVRKVVMNNRDNHGLTFDRLPFLRFALVKRPEDIERTKRLVVRAPSSEEPDLESSPTGLQ